MGWVAGLWLPVLAILGTRNFFSLLQPPSAAESHMAGSKPPAELKPNFPNLASLGYAYTAEVQDHCAAVNARAAAVDAESRYEHEHGPWMLRSISTMRLTRPRALFALGFISISPHQRPSHWCLG